MKGVQACNAGGELVRVSSKFLTIVAFLRLVISEMFQGVTFKPQTPYPFKVCGFTQRTPYENSLFKSLYVQVLSAIAIGILLGHFYPELGAQMKPSAMPSLS
jgi:hypothetical protein